jgi:hypothetical protein
LCTPLSQTPQTSKTTRKGYEKVVMREQKKGNTTRGPQYRIVVEDTLTDSQLKSMNKQYREESM